MHYALIIRQFKVDFAKPGKVSALGGQSGPRPHWSDVRPCGVRHETDE